MNDTGGAGALWLRSKARLSLRSISALRALVLAGAVCVAMLCAAPAALAQYVVTQTTDDGTGGTIGTLSNAILMANATGGTITFALPVGNTVTLTGSMYGISAAAPIVIDGGGVTIDAAGHQAFTINSGFVQLSNLAINNGLAAGGIGGNGNGGGGGGLGAGGAIFVGPGAGLFSTVNVSFTGNAAVGGAGGIGTGMSANGGNGGGYNANAGPNTAPSGTGGGAGAIGAGDGMLGGAGGGGGGGSTGATTVAPGGSGGGNGGLSGQGGGGGAARGGAIYIADSAIFMILGNTNFGGNNSVTGGAAGAGAPPASNGAAEGGAIYAGIGSQLNFNPTGGDLVTPGSIVSDGAVQIFVSGGTAIFTGTVDVRNTINPSAKTITFGTMQIGNGGTSGSISGVIDNGGTLIFDRSDASTYEGGLEGSGTLRKRGGGLLSFNGTNAFSGATYVEAGTLAVNGTMFNSAVTVQSGGTLGGSGAVGGVIVNAGGIIAPGNSIGNFNVNGGITFNTGSVYAVEVSPTDADHLGVSGGTANLSNGTVAVTFAPGTYVNRQYTIVTSANGFGSTTFAGVTDNAPGIATTLTYDYYNVYLNIEIVLAAIEQETNGGKTRTPLNQNQRAVAEAIDAYFAQHGTMPSAFVTLDANGLTQAAGLVSTASVGAGMQAAGQFLDAMGGADAGGSTPAGDTSNAYAPLAYSAEPANLSSPGALAALGAEVPASSDAANAVLAMSSAHAADPVDVAMAKRWAMWGTVYGSVGRIGGDPVVGSADLTARNWGIASGFERSFGNSRLGLSLGGAGSTFSLSGGLGNGSAGIFNAGIYGSHSFGNAYVSGALGYGWNNVRTTRNVPGDTLTANFNAHTLAGRIETGYRFGSTSAITPYVALQGGNYFLPAYTETSALGGPFALNYARQSEAFLRTELGARFEHSMPTSTGSLKFSARAAWAYNAINDRAVTAAFAALPGQTFTVNGARPARSAALLDLGVEASFDSGLSAKLNFNGEFSRNVSAYGASAKLIYRW